MGKYNGLHNYDRHHNHTDLENIAPRKNIVFNSF